MTWFDQFSSVQGFAEAHRVALESMQRDIAQLSKHQDPTKAIAAIDRLDVYADFLELFIEDVRGAARDARRTLID